MEKRYELTENQALNDSWEEIGKACMAAWGSLPKAKALDLGYEMQPGDGTVYTEYIAVVCDEAALGHLHPSGIKLCLRMILELMRRSHATIKWGSAKAVKYILFIRAAEERPKFVRTAEETA